MDFNTSCVIKDIGNISGEMLVFGGVYSNLHALKALKKEADYKRIRPTNIICTGDIVAYCAYPEECVQFIKDWGIHCIAGNVELNLTRSMNDCTDCDSNFGGKFDEESKSWYPFLKESLSKESLDSFFDMPKNIKFQKGGKRFFVLHGSIFNPSQFIYPSTDWLLKEDNFKACHTDCIIGGHSGIPFIERKNNHTWINAGSIGMPANDGTPDTWYMTLSDESATFHSLKYDYESAVKAFEGKPLPDSCSSALVSGIWEMVDLPLEEKAATGLPLAIKKPYPLGVAATL